MVIAGDGNTDLGRPGEFADTVLFSVNLNLSLVDLNFRDDVGFTYLGHDGSKSWLDHVAVSDCFRSSVASVHSILDGRNLSDHNPLVFSLDLSSRSSRYSRGQIVNWHLATSNNVSLSAGCSAFTLGIKQLPDMCFLLRPLLYCSSESVREDVHATCLFA